MRYVMLHLIPYPTKQDSLFFPYINRPYFPLMLVPT